MSSTATQAQEAHQPAAAAEALNKRKREEAADDADEEAVERNSKYGLDRDILDCPICIEPFSPPVFQCQNGHTACSACCKKLDRKKCPTCTLPTGVIRCIAIEKLVESLLVGCKYARHGCEKMERSSDIQTHERYYCDYKPFPCPVPECDYEASRDPLLWHLTGVHQIKTVAHNFQSESGVSFRMGPSNRFVIVKTIVIYIVHCVVHESMGVIFFCTVFGSDGIDNFNLQVRRRGHSVPHVMECAQAILLRQVEEYLGMDFLLVPAKPFSERCSFEVNFKVTYDDNVYNDTDDEDD